MLSPYNGKNNQRKKMSSQSFLWLQNQALRAIFAWRVVKTLRKRLRSFLVGN